jgi:hypothetical protein
MKWRQVTSSNVAEIGWPSKSDHPYGIEAPLLLVRFKDGRCYGYLGVSRSRAVYIATRCPSPGTYINHTIKPNFDVVRIPAYDIK